jgi:phosphoglycolate phosphatase
LIFDLDGTLTDSMPGIVGCLRKVLDARNMGDCGRLERFVGPPVDEWTAELLPAGSEEERAELARAYRACYDQEGWSNNSLFSGVLPMLNQFRSAGFPLYVCTSKREHFAVRVLERYGLAGFFHAVYGDNAAYKSHSKADLLAKLLNDCAIAVENAWMIGDRIYDIQAAHQNRVRCVAAAWGYGSAAEYAQADAIARTPGDLQSVVASEADGQAARS